MSDNQQPKTSDGASASKPDTSVADQPQNVESPGTTASGNRTILQTAVSNGNPKSLIPPPPGGEIQLSGILPMFCTGATQELFKIKGGVDLTEEIPMKFIPKADFMADINTRCAISDFYPAKQVISDYPGEELLIHWDPEFKYGQNFFIFITVEAVDLLLKPVIAEVSPEELATEVTKAAPKPRKWECLGSDKEIESERVSNIRPLINVQVSRKRREFGIGCKFEDRDAQDGFLECRPFRDANYEISRMELEIGIQAIPYLNNTTAQTDWFRPLNMAIQYEPRTMKHEEQKLSLHSENLQEFVGGVSRSIENFLLQNSMMDIFLDDYKDLGEEDLTIQQGVHATLQEYQSFTDLKHSKERCLSAVDWHPTQTGVVVVSCTQRMTFDERVEAGFPVRSKKALLLIWSFHDPIHPQLILEAPDDINCFQFNPYDTNLIAGGCISGQIVLWDISEYEDKLKSTRKRNDDSGDKSGKERHVETALLRYFAVSSIEFSHRGPISDLHWLPKNMELAYTGELIENGENGHKQLVTTSQDGQVFFWDTRSKKELRALDLAWKPFLRIPLSAMDNTFDYGLTKISINTMALLEKSASETNIVVAVPETPTKDKKDAKKDEKAGPNLRSKFYCATEEGDLIYADWIQEKTTEEKASRVERCFSCHFGPMSDIQRSPFFPDIILSVGGWTFHIWKESVTIGSLLSSPPSQAYLIGARWSPTRPGVFYISKYDGTIEVWDLLDKSHLPSSVQNVSSVGISSMAIKQYSGKGQTNHQFIAAGDDEGTLHILEIPRNLIKPSKNEKAAVKSFFEREARRLQYTKERTNIRVSEKADWEQKILATGQAQISASTTITKKEEPEEKKARG